MMVLRASIIAAALSLGLTGAASAASAPRGTQHGLIEVDGLKLAYAKKKKHHRHHGWSRGRHYGWHYGRHPRSRYYVTRHRRHAPRYYGYAPRYYERPAYYGRGPYYAAPRYRPYPSRPGVTLRFGY
jgi:hypothetical protein